MLLDDVPVIDNHCHGFVRIPPGSTLQEWRAHFTEARDPEMLESHVPSMLSYQRVLHRLAGFLGCEPREEEVFRERQMAGDIEMIRSLLDDANVKALIVDRGFPSPDSVIPDDAIYAASSIRFESLLRLEPLMEKLIMRHESLSEAKDALAQELSDVRGAAFVGLKSIAAYRCGLDIREWNRAEAESAFAAERVAASTGTYRLMSKPVLESLLVVALEAANEQELPVQFHVGYGDSDVDMLKTNPLHMRSVLESGRYRGATFVLLHECYPYTREGAYLAAIYENVYLDLSYGIPFLGRGELLSFTRAALAVAPGSKLMYSSDGVGVPELHWASAIEGREVLAEVLDDCVTQNELSDDGARAVGEAILRDNALRVYGLQP